MHRTYKRLAFLILFAALIFPRICYGAWVWTPETGRWLNPKDAVKDTAEEQFKYAMSFYDMKDHRRAVSEFDKVVKFYPNAKSASDAQYYIGRCYEDTEEYYHAYLAYQKVIEAYPYAKNREEIIERQYNIGVLFLQGEKAKILGVALLPATDKAIEIFEQVVRNSPYGACADRAQYKIGESYKKSMRFAEAALAFQKLVEEYPQSGLVKEANYEIAQCAYLASLDASYDQGPTDMAIEKFEGVMKEGGDASLPKEAQASLGALKDKKAKSLCETARFYEKTGHRQSAAVYYKEVVENYPDSTVAKDCLSRLMEIEKGSER